MFQLFGGKGGVGKTTCAASAARALAADGQRVLAVSTDPAHSLGDAFGVPFDQPLGPEPMPIKIPITVRKGTLLAAELDAGRALARWLGARRADLETLAERGTYLDRDDIRRFLDLSLPGIDELVGLVELLRLARETPCDEVVVDTAPTAHTLRLLAMPAELRRLAAALDRLEERHRALADTFGRGFQPDHADALIAEIESDGREIEELLRDPQRTVFRWVLLPEALSVAETLDGVKALEEAGIAVPELIVNQMAPEGADPARRRAEEEAVAALRKALPGKRVLFVPEVEGPLPLPLPRAAPAPPPRAGEGRHRPKAKKEKELKKHETGGGSPLPRAVERWAAGEGLGEGALLFFGGKGGVGKTTCAAAAALLFAESHPGKRILLLSTDPAHSLGDVLETELGDEVRAVPGAPDNLRARELDAARTFAEWRSRHLADLDGWLASAGGAAEQEAWQGLLDLAPPGLDELSAVSAMVDLLPADGPPPYDLVVIDTAPTGHTLRLLETPGLMLEWVQALLALLLKYREAVPLGRLAEELLALSRGLKRLGEALRDPARARFLAVTRTGELPRRETKRLLQALDHLFGDTGLAVPAVIVNRAEPGRRLPARRDLAGRAMIVAPAAFPPPRGAAALAAWGRTWEIRPA